MRTIHERSVLSACSSNVMLCHAMPCHELTLHNYSTTTAASAGGGMTSKVGGRTTNQTGAVGGGGGAGGGKGNVQVCYTVLYCAVLSYTVLPCTVCPV
jgi:hypothetical protein